MSNLPQSCIMFLVPIGLERDLGSFQILTKSAQFIFYRKLSQMSIWLKLQNVKKKKLKKLQYFLQQIWKKKTVPSFSEIKIIQNCFFSFRRNLGQSFFSFFHDSIMKFKCDRTCAIVKNKPTRTHFARTISKGFRTPFAPKLPHAHVRSHFRTHAH